MKDDDTKSEKTMGEQGISQIPLLKDVVFDVSLPLKTPVSPKRTRITRTISEHGPDYDPDTLDLFDQSVNIKDDPEEAGSDSAKNAYIERANIEQAEEHLTDNVLIDNEPMPNKSEGDMQAQEDSEDMPEAMRDDLNEQLHSILDELKDTPKDN